MKRTQGSSQPPYSLDRKTLEREVVIKALRTGGPGGQHRNVTDSAIRLLHAPSGVCRLPSLARSIEIANVRLRA